MNTDSKWWEFYGVRYAQGTVIGSVILYFLFSQNKTLSKLLFIPVDAKDFGVSHLILLGIYGLAFCYISSAPILIFHAARGLLYTQNNNLSIKSIFRAVLRVIPVIAVAAILTALTQWSLVGFSIDNTLNLFLLFIFTSIQLFMLFNIFVFSWKETFDYYKSITNKRKNHPDYVESYKHIREHGNSFFIVFLEMCLGTSIYHFSTQALTSEETTRNLFLIILIWVLPSLWIWFYGNKLEFQLKTMKP